MPEKLMPENLTELQKECVFIDTRAPEVYASCHIKNSINIPEGAAFFNWAAMVIPKGTPIVLIVKDEEEAKEVMNQLSTVGLTHVEGFVVWDRKLGLPLDSLELLAVQDLNEADDIYLVDVRTVAEWNMGHIPSAHHMELAKFLEKMKEIPKNQRVATICGSGFRASIAASLLQKDGYQNVANVQGGMQAWKLAHLPVRSFLS